VTRSEQRAVVLTLLPHGEHGAVVRFLGEAHGLRAGYVAGARGRDKRAVVAPGNRVALTLRARAEGQLPQATVELVESRALLAFDAEPAATLAWLAALTATMLAEDVPHPRLFAALDGLLTGLDAGMTGPALKGAVARYELLLLAEEGLGLDLSVCALGGPADDLAFVSPTSGRAVSRMRALGQPWAARLIPLPAFLAAGAVPDAEAAAAALALSGHFLWRHWPQQQARIGALRARLTGTERERLAASPVTGKAGG
jgi:DNA repair protein RecO (recombination protein O)